VHKVLATSSLVALSTLLLGQADVSQLDPLPLSSDGYMVGRHLGRLQFASRECGGSFDSTKVELFDRATQLGADLGALKIFNGRSSNGLKDEGTRLEALRGTNEICQRLYKLYGPNGITARGAYDPTTIGLGRPAAPRPWWAAVNIVPHPQRKDTRPKRPGGRAAGA
jgi:hypothetical protein